MGDMIKSIVLAIVGLVVAIALLIAALLVFSLLVMAVGAILNIFSPSRSAPWVPKGAAP
jgi:hypothetical protein